MALNRLRARRWQRWSEVPVEEDWLGWARAGAFVVVAFSLLIVAVVVALLLS
jgi:hypothetical protein